MVPDPVSMHSLTLPGAVFFLLGILAIHFHQFRSEVYFATPLEICLAKRFIRSASAFQVKLYENDG